MTDETPPPPPPPSTTITDTSNIIIRRFDPNDTNDRSVLLSLVKVLQQHEIAVYDRMKQPEDLGDDYVEYLQTECEKHEGQILFAEVEEEEQRQQPIIIAMNATDNGEPSSQEEEEKKANHNKTVLGYAVLLTKIVSDRIEEVDFQYGLLAELAVVPSARGKGIGKRLLETCEQTVRDAGIQYFRTEVLASNPSAYQVYKRFGFHDHIVTMEKQLNI